MLGTYLQVDKPDNKELTRRLMVKLVEEHGPGFWDLPRRVQDFLARLEMTKEKLAEMAAKE